MYSPLRLALKYFKYYLAASNGKGHGIHSPFIFHFITKLLNDKNYYPEYEKVEALRSAVQKDKTLLKIEDFGAGSGIDKKDRRSIASIAKHAAKPKKYGQLLFRMVKEYQPRTIIELGTSMGITTSYLALANSQARVITMEGAGEVADIADQNFKNLGLLNVQVIKGNFDQTLPGMLDELPTVDFAFIDGNHRQEPTERYFNQLVGKTNNESILVVDDIHWSPEMEAAWNTMKKHPCVRSTIDLFFMGILLFRQEFKEKQHFYIRF